MRIIVDTETGYYFPVEESAVLDLTSAALTAFERLDREERREYAARNGRPAKVLT